MENVCTVTQIRLGEGGGGDTIGGGGRRTENRDHIWGVMLMITPGSQRMQPPETPRPMNAGQERDIPHFIFKLFGSRI